MSKTAVEVVEWSDLGHPVRRGLVGGYGTQAMREGPRPVDLLEPTDLPGPRGRPSFPGPSPPHRPEDDEDDEPDG
jgi:hypothetical protein